MGEGAVSSHSRSATIIGVGLIGASIALGLRSRGWHIEVYDPDADTRAYVAENEIAHVVHATLDDAVGASPDVVIIAAPPKATTELVASLETSLPVMDVASVKEPVVAAAQHLPSFVGTHPMAGREVSGPRGASAALFSGASWVVVPGPDPEANVIVGEVIETLGARIIEMRATDHDAAVAVISHVPHAIAGVLLHAADHVSGAMDLAAGSFRDLTRVAAASPIPWTEILKVNRTAVLATIADVRARLAEFEASIESEDDTLLAALARGAELRARLGAPVSAVRVALADEPGELAKVGHAFDAAAVDIRDLQLRHAPYGGGGVLSVFVRGDDEPDLRAALESEGLLLVE